MRTIEIMVCYVDRTWDIHTAETDIPEDKLDEQTLMSLLPEYVRTGEPGSPTIATVHIYHIDQEVDEDKPETMEERLQRCCRLVFELADQHMAERGEDVRKGDSEYETKEEWNTTLAELFAVKKIVERAYDLRKAVVELSHFLFHVAIPSNPDLKNILPENLDDETFELIMDTSLAEEASKLLDLTAESEPETELTREDRKFVKELYDRRRDVFKALKNDAPKDPPFGSHRQGTEGPR